MNYCKQNIFFNEGWIHIWSLHILRPHAISWLNVRVWLMLRLAGVVVSESGDCISYIRQNQQAHFAVVVVPIEIQTQVLFALPILGYFVVLSEDCY